MAKLERRTMNTIKDIVHALELTYVREEFLEKILWGCSSSFFSQSYARGKLPVVKKEREELRGIYRKLTGKRYYHVGNITRQLRLVTYL